MMFNVKYISMTTMKEPHFAGTGCLYESLYVIYEQRERVFHRDIQTRENNV